MLIVSVFDAMDAKILYDLIRCEVHDVIQQLLELRLGDACRMVISGEVLLVVCEASLGQVLRNGVTLKCRRMQFKAARRGTTPSNEYQVPRS